MLEECAQNVSFLRSLSHEHAGNYNDISIENPTENGVVLAIADDFFLLVCTELIALFGVSPEDIGHAIQEDCF